MIKWLSNFWYHYKFRTVMCLILAVVVGIGIYEAVTREDYDMKVYLYMSQVVSSDVERALEETIEDYFSKNGEEKNVCVINFSYDPYAENGDNKMSHAAALAGELRMKKDFLFITDSYRFEELNTNEVFENVFSKQDYFDKYDNKAFSIKGSAFETDFIKSMNKNNVTVSKMPELFVSLVNAPEKDSKNYQNYIYAEELAKLIVNSK